MKMDDLILVSVDDHVVEPPNMFQQHLSKEHLAAAPQFTTEANGSECWIYEGKKITNIGLNAVVGRPKSEYGVEPTSFSQMRPAVYDIDKRIEDMNVSGILGSMCFGTFVGFDGGLFLSATDKKNALRVVRAYNDWHIDEWCGAHPGRMIPLSILPLWSMGETLKEIKRVVNKGCHAISFPDNPSVKGLPSIHNDYWRPLWNLCDELKVVINCHIGSGYQPPHPSMESPINCWITSMPISIANAASDWMHLRALIDHKNLKIALSEGGIGWIPYLMERADFTYSHHGEWTGVEFGGKKPSEIFREHFLTCFIDDKYGLDNYKAIGEDLIMFETDYPHSDCVWPNAPELLWESVKGMSRDVVDKITHKNAMREYSYDPFSILNREDCTVAALRSKAKDVDTGTVSYGGYVQPFEKGKPVTSGDVVKLFQQQFEGEIIT